jgi:cell division protein FtsB
MDFRMKPAKVRVVVRHWPSLRAVADRAPEVEAFAARTVGRVRDRLGPVFGQLYSLRRRLATGGVIVLTTWLFVHVMFGANGMVVYRQKKTEYQNLEQEVDRLEKENDRYTQQIQDLKTDPKTIEKEAREQLHYARPGEVVYVSPASPPASRSTTDAAQK